MDQCRKFIIRIPFHRVINRNQTDIEAAIMSNPMLASHGHQFIMLSDFNVDISSTQFREYHWIRQP
jgi:hypothetical protein